MLDANFNNEDLLNRICEVYGFSQKIQLANHFNIAASSLQNRYKRGNLSYDFAVHCALETGTNLKWLMTGEGDKGVTVQPAKAITELPLFTLSEGQLFRNGEIAIGTDLFGKPLNDAQCIRSEGKSHFVEKNASVADGLWLVDIERAMSLREITVLPGKRLHVAGGKFPFECSVNEILLVGRVIGIYSETK